MRELIVSILMGLSLGFVVGVAVEGKLTNMDQRIVQKKCLWPADNGTFTAEPFTKTCFMSKDPTQKVDCTTLIRMDEFNHMKHCFQ